VELFGFASLVTGLVISESSSPNVISSTGDILVLSDYLFKTLHFGSDGLCEFGEELRSREKWLSRSYIYVKLQNAKFTSLFCMSVDVG
jgi:hypothetical protein